jgi:hypothetical protein
VEIKGTGIFPTLITNSRSVKKTGGESICKITGSQWKVGIVPVIKILGISVIRYTTDTSLFIFSL